MPTPTPVTDQVRIQLRRLRKVARLSLYAASTSAGLSRNSWAYWEQRGSAPRLDCLERGVDMLGLKLSEFIRLCEEAAVGVERPLEVLEREVRPPRDWQDAVAQAAACLRVDAFGGGLLRYDGRWCVLVPLANGRVRLCEPRGGEAELAGLAEAIERARGPEPRVALPEPPLSKVAAPGQRSDKRRKVGR